MPMATDAELIAASLIDPERFAALFERHYDSIAGFLRRRLEPSLADELAAETFLRAFDGRRRYDLTRADALPWLYGISTHLVARHRRSEERRLRAFARAGRAYDPQRESEDVDARLDAAAASPALATALRCLGSADREVLLLYAWAELTYEQIAVALEIPLGTVRSRLHRARLVLRRELERAGAGAVLTAAGDARAAG